MCSCKTAKVEKSDFDTFREPNWTITNDVENNDMMPLVNTILDSGKSWNINGRAGTGKSYLAKMLQEEMANGKINLIAWRLHIKPP